VATRPTTCWRSDFVAARVGDQLSKMFWSGGMPMGVVQPWPSLAQRGWRRHDRTLTPSAGGAHRITTGLWGDLNLPDSSARIRCLK
jgi:hypothetical protein